MNLYVFFVKLYVMDDTDISALRLKSWPYIYTSAGHKADLWWLEYSLSWRDDQLWLNGHLNVKAKAGKKHSYNISKCVFITDGVKNMWLVRQFCVGDHASCFENYSF